MRGSVDEERWRSHGRAPTRVARLARAIRVDLRRLHAAWIELLFPRELRNDYSVVERWTVQTKRAAATYQAWAAVGGLLLTVGYPLYLVGLAVRFHARRLDRASASLGMGGLLVVSLLAWGALTAATYAAPIATEGVIAVAAAGAVASVSAILARRVTRSGRRSTTVALGYPLATTAIFLPPVVASLYSPTLAAVVFPGSRTLAVWLLAAVLDPVGVGGIIRAWFDLEGLAFVGMWFGIAVPVGWTFGLLVALADIVRPSPSRTVDDVYRGR